MKFRALLIFCLSLMVWSGCDGCDKDNPAGPDAATDGAPPPDGKMEEPEVVCEELAPISSGVCAVTPGDGRKLIKGTILAPDTTYRGGQVAVDATGNITCVGCNCAQGGETVISCPNGVVSPGMINTHEHITFTGNAPYTDSGERYEHRHDWRKGIRGHTKIPSPSTPGADSVRWGELRFLLGGTTSIVGSGGQAGLLRNLDRGNLMEGLTAKPVNFETFPLDDNGGNQRAGDCNYGGMADTLAKIMNDDSYEPHVAEGIDEVSRNEFLCLSSATYDSTAPGVSNDLTIAKTAMIHGTGLGAADFGLMAERGTALIWSPRSNITLYGDTAPVTVAARMGVEIALGSDWVLSGSMNMNRELQCADRLNKTYYNNFFTDRDLWLMVTRNAANVTGTGDKIGSLAMGRIADIAIFNGITNTKHRAVIASEPKDVALVMRGGKVLYGDAAVVTAIPGSGACDAVDVCTNQKQVCLMSEVGKTYSALKAAGGAGYADFFCGEPDKEPSCTPTRSNAVDGSTVYTGAPSATDSDGDGIANANDNCPMVFNPVRPVDKGMQANADGDGEGDACDVCPLDANTPSCTPVNPNDSDRDGITNAIDNCPATPNATQIDGDNDGKGDACDACPTLANPGSAACPATIYSIKMGTVMQGAGVRVENALVTGKGSNGFFIQVKEGDAGYMGSDFSGIFVFTGAMSPNLAAVTVGNRVTIDAVVGSFQTSLQLSSISAVTVVNAGVEALPAPIAATLAEVKLGGPRADKLDGVIIQTPASTVSAVDTMFGEFTATAGADSLKVDDFLFALNPAPTVGRNFSSITGILHKRQMEPKLLPRSAADLSSGAVTLTSIGPATSFVDQGQMMSQTGPTALTVTLSGPATANTVVAVTSSDPNILTVSGGGVTIATGQSSGVILVNGLAPGQVNLTATLGATSLMAAVRVVGNAEQPVLEAITPLTASVNAGGTATFTVTLDIPARVGGTTVSLALNPVNAGTIPASVTVPAGQLSATFDYIDGSQVTTATITATLGATSKQATVNVSSGANHLVINEVDYDQPATDGDEYIEIKNPTGQPIDLTNFAISLINGSTRTEYKRIPLAPAGTLMPGKYLVISRANFTVGADGTLFTPANWAATNNIENGAPDGVALLDTVTNAVVDALSYEGEIPIFTLGAFGMVNLVEGTALPAATADSNTAAGSLCRSPDGVDGNNAVMDWRFCTTPTPGTANTP